MFLKKIFILTSWLFFAKYSPFFSKLFFFNFESNDNNVYNSDQYSIL